MLIIVLSHDERVEKNNNMYNLYNYFLQNSNGYLIKTIELYCETLKGNLCICEDKK